MKSINKEDSYSYFSDNEIIEMELTYKGHGRDEIQVVSYQNPELFRNTLFYNVFSRSERNDYYNTVEAIQNLIKEYDNNNDLSEFTTKLKELYYTI